MRPSGRAPDQMRAITIEPHFTRHAEGSVLIGFGDTRVLVTGRYLDKLVRTDHGLRFQEKLCVYDSALIPGSIVAPI